MDPQGQLGKVLGFEVRRPRHSAIELLVDSVLGEGAAKTGLATASLFVDESNSTILSSALR